MKYRYQRLSKEEKKAWKQTYYNTTAGKSMNIRLVRLMFTGIIGFLVALYIITNNIINNNVDWTTWITTIPLMIASIIFISASFILRIKNLNMFIVKEEKKHTKKI